MECWRGCLERGADLHMAQLMPLSLTVLTVSCFSKIQIGFTFLVPAHPGSPGKTGPLNGCVCVIKEICSWLPPFCIHNLPFTHPMWQPRTIAGWLRKGTFTAQPKDRFTLVNQIKSRSRHKISPTRPGNDISQEFTSLVVTTKLQSLAYNM